jgi:hypothetical protein
MERRLTNSYVDILLFDNAMSSDNQGFEYFNFFEATVGDSVTSKNDLFIVT